MESKYRKRLSQVLPLDFGVNTNKNDGLYILANELGALIENKEQELDKKIGGLSIDSFDPMTVYKTNYIQLEETDDVDNLKITPEKNSNSIVTDDQSLFFSSQITGFDFVEAIEPTGIQPIRTYKAGTVFPSGSLEYPENYMSWNEFIAEYPSGVLTNDLQIKQIAGLTYSFDWDNPCFYLSSVDHDQIYKYKDFKVIPEMQDFIYDKQDFETKNEDEWINIYQERVTEEDILPSGLVEEGVLVGDIVNVAYLKEAPINGVKLIDTNNLQDINNINSDGIVVTADNYSIRGNKLIFNNHRTDYNPRPSSQIEVSWYNTTVNMEDNQIIRQLDTLSALTLKCEGNWSKMTNYLLSTNSENYFYTDSEFHVIDIQNNNFDIYFNMKIDSNIQFADIEFKEDNLELSLLNDKITINFPQLNEFYEFETDIDFSYSFNTIHIKYLDGTLSLYVNGNLIKDIQPNITFTQLFNIKYGYTSNFVKLTDFIFSYKGFYEDTDKNLNSYFKEKNNLLNYEDNTVLPLVEFSPNENLDVDENMNVIGWYGKNVSDYEIMPTNQNLKYKNDGTYAYIENTDSSTSNVNINIGESTILVLSRGNNFTINLEDITLTANKGENRIGINNNYYEASSNDDISVTSFILSNTIKARRNSENIITVGNPSTGEKSLSLSGSSGDIYYIIVYNQVLTDHQIEVTEEYLLNLVQENEEYDIDNIKNPEYKVNGPFQPDPGFNSSYIVEYKYIARKPAKYLTTDSKFYKLQTGLNILTNTDENN